MRPPSRARSVRFHREAERAAYDAIVVGSGIGGLTTAALLARAGRSVLVVERHDRPGGYAHAFRRGRFHIDSAVHMVGGCDPERGPEGGLIGRLLELLEVGDRCQFEPIDPVYRAVYPGLTIDAPSGLEAFTATHAELFPAAATGLRELLGHCVEVRSELARFSELSNPLDVLRDPDALPRLRAYGRSTLAQVARQSIGDPGLRAVIGTLWPYLGLPPDRVSFLYWATMLLSYVDDGAYYCKGTFQRLADALAFSIKRAGGELLLRSTVRRVQVQGGRACGIVLENGQRISAPVIVSNADVMQTATELVGERDMPHGYLRSLERMERSTSAFVVYAATELDLVRLGARHETFVFQDWDHATAYERTQAGNPDWITITVPTLSDPDLAPPGQHLLVLTTLLPYAASKDWRAAKPRWTERLLEIAARQYPGLLGSLTFVEAATPRTMERYTRNTEGAIYGWALGPNQIGPQRTACRSPLPGLHLAGHWTQPGGGVYGVTSSGLNCAREILGYRTARELFDSLASST